MQLVDMNLEWLKVLPTFSGWVSENWFAFGRIIRWIYSTLPDISPELGFVKPTKPIKYWLLSECDNYLQYYSYSKEGNVKDKREQICELENDPNTILLNPEERIGSVNQVEDLIPSLSIALSYAISAEVNGDTIISADRHFRIFLTMAESLSKKIYTQNSKSKLESSYSFLAVIHLPYIMKQCGSLQHIWESSFQGESILAELKPLVNDQRTNCHFNAGCKYHLKKSLKTIMEANVQQSFSSYIGFNFCSYSSFDEVREILNQNVAISVICDVDKGYFAML